MTNPLLEVRRAAGGFALLLSFVYALGLVSAVIAITRHVRFPVLGYLMLLLPLVVFVPSTVAAVQLHRTEDPDRTRTLWRRALLLALVGTAMWISVVIIFRRRQPQ
ncbi:MAG: hypothetical protein AUG44_00370 [Actinobacteria bacterium 13_1_20CM_3_71_11]|nr:MAG: hypothetical protein AUG44_00370 [Actinobacteria bacterium 13_1_20CM_3_71_11]